MNPRAPSSVPVNGAAVDQGREPGAAELCEVLQGGLEGSMSDSGPMKTSLLKTSTPPRSTAYILSSGSSKEFVQRLLLAS